MKMMKYSNRIFTARSKMAIASIVEESRKDNTLTEHEKHEIQAQAERKFRKDYNPLFKGFN